MNIEEKVGGSSTSRKMAANDENYEDDGGIGI